MWYGGGVITTAANRVVCAGVAPARLLLVDQTDPGLGYIALLAPEALTIRIVSCAAGVATLLRA